MLLRSFPELWYSWRHQLAEFQQDYHVAAFDLRGYGASEKPQVLLKERAFSCRCRLTHVALLPRIMYG
jgi:pimeloyl-ACP methyl ester carboxylesterase